MDAAKPPSLRTYYESLSDEALLAEAALGRDAFASEAWTIISDQIELRGLEPGHAHRHSRDAGHDVAVAEPRTHQPSHAERLAARIDALPPSIRPAAFGASLVVIFAMARGAWLILPVLVIYVLATSPDPWSSLMTGAGIGVLAMVGGALSGFAYSLVGRRVRTAIRGGYYLTGNVTLAPYMFVLRKPLRRPPIEMLSRATGWAACCADRLRPRFSVRPLPIPHECESSSSLIR